MTDLETIERLEAERDAYAKLLCRLMRSLDFPNGGMDGLPHGVAQATKDIEGCRKYTIQRFVKERAVGRDAGEAMAIRYVRRMRDLENRADYARDILSGKLDVPAINAMRKAQGLEEMPQLSEDLDVADL